MGGLALTLSMHTSVCVNCHTQVETVWTNWTPVPQTGEKLNVLDACYSHMRNWTAWAHASQTGEKSGWASKTGIKVDTLFPK